MGTFARRAALSAVVAVAGSTLLASSSRAAPLRYDSFDYAVGQTIDTQTFWVDPTAPTQPADAQDTQTVVAGNLTYSGLAPSAGNSLSVPRTPHGNMAILQLPDTYEYDSSTGVGDAPDGLFLSTLIRFGDVAGTSQGWVTGFNRNRDGAMSTANWYVGMVWVRQNPADASRFNLGISKNNAAGFAVDWADDSFAPNDTAFVVARYLFDTTADNTDDTASLWINPTPGESMPAPSAESSTGPDVYVDTASGRVSNLRSAFIRSNGLSGTNNTPANLVFDEFRVGLSYADVTPVPEPASSAALALALGGLAARSCRRARR